MATAAQADVAARRPLAAAAAAIINPKPTRLRGALAPTTVIGNGVTKKERFRCSGWAKITVLLKVSATASDPVLSLHPMTAPATQDDTDGAERHTFGAPTPVTVVDGINAIQYEPIGEEYVEIEVVCDAGDATTVTWCDVFGQ